MLVLYCALASCAGPSQFERFVSEQPPCRLPALSKDEVLAIARKVLGNTYYEQPEPTRSVTEQGCVYKYRQYVESQALDASDTADLVIRRDRRVWQFGAYP